MQKPTFPPTVALTLNDYSLRQELKDVLDKFSDGIKDCIFSHLK